MIGFIPDKSVIRRHFQQAAETYETTTIIEREAGDRMFSRLEYMKLQPQRIIDAGSGTGYFSEKLARYYPQAQVIELDFALAMLQYSQQSSSQWNRWLSRQKKRPYICADIEAIPLYPQSVDMIWANCTLLWQDTPDQMLAECYRVLNTNGLLMFCTFGPDTLKELRLAFAQTDVYQHVHRFVDMHDIGDALIRQGFLTPVMDMEYITIQYDEVLTLLHDLKTTGATNALFGRPQGLMGKQAWQKMLAQYEQLRSQGELPATYEIIYGHAWKGLPKIITDQQTITFHPKKTYPSKP